MSEAPEYPLDKLDLQILKHLGQDGRKSFQVIAKNLDVSYGTVRNRYLKMREKSNLRIVSWIPPASVGLLVFANFRVSVDAPMLDNVAKKIAEFPEVNYLARTIGEFDLFGEVSCRNVDFLTRLIDQKINKMEGVKQTRVALYTTIFKQISLPNIVMVEEFLEENNRDRNGQFN